MFCDMQKKLYIKCNLAFMLIGIYWLIYKNPNKNGIAHTNFKKWRIEEHCEDKKYAVKNIFNTYHSITLSREISIKYNFK
jgi:hypothetical protein